MSKNHTQMHPDSGAGRRPTVRELEILRAMIDFGKTTSAAAQLGLSQPAISRALQSLEARLGHQLFTRVSGNLVPTASALRFYRDGISVLSLLDGMVAGSHQPASGTIRLIAPPTLTRFFLEDMVARFLKENPRTRFHFEVAPSSDVIAQVAEGRADLGITDTLAGHPGVRRIVLRRAVAHVLVPADHPLAGRASLRPEDLVDQPLIALTRRFHVRARIDDLFRAIGAEPQIVAEVATSALARGFVRAGLGIALINPFPLTLSPDRALALVPFEPALPYETTILVSSGLPISEAAEAFTSFTRNRQPEDGLTTPIR